MGKKKQSQETEKNFSERLLEILQEQTESLKKIESCLATLLEIFQARTMSGSVLEEIRSDLSTIKYEISSMKRTLEKLEWKTLW